MEAMEGLRPSSEIKMHMRCYADRLDIGAVVHAHPPETTGFAVAHKPMDVYNMIKVVPAEKDWEFVIKMTLIVHDILFGNPKLADKGWHEEALGKNVVAGGFQGQRNWTDWLPDGDFMEAMLASTFNWNGAKAPTPFATENDTRNGVSMLRIPVSMHNVPEDQIFRPHAWAAFGTADLESADMRACGACGALYQ